MGKPAAVRPSSAFTTVDLDGAGKQVGFLMIPHSPNDDAWGVTRIPLAVIQNGSGPTVVLEAGNHGDEYEGQIAIGELIRELDPGRVQGRLILMPANNVHAVIAGQRVSPVDGLNFNRTFPGDTRGTITAQIAAFVADHIYPRADAFLDLHSGGSSLDILPSTVIEPTDDPVLHAKSVAAARAFDAPFTVVISNLGEPRTATAAACRAGLITVGTEMAGGGTVSIEALAICRRGVRNVLAHLGVLPPRTRRRGGATAPCSSCPARAPSCSRPWTASSSRCIGTARRCAPASAPAASTAPGTRRGRRTSSSTRPTASSTGAASPAGCGPATAASRSRRRTAARSHSRRRRRARRSAGSKGRDGVVYRAARRGAVALTAFSILSSLFSILSSLARI